MQATILERITGQVALSALGRSCRKNAVWITLARAKRAFPDAVGHFCRAEPIKSKGAKGATFPALRCFERSDRRRSIVITTESRKNAPNLAPSHFVRIGTFPVQGDAESAPKSRLEPDSDKRLNMGWFMGWLSSNSDASDCYFPTDPRMSYTSASILQLILEF